MAPGLVLVYPAFDSIPQGSDLGPELVGLGSVLGVRSVDAGIQGIDPTVQAGVECENAKGEGGEDPQGGPGQRQHDLSLAGGSDMEAPQAAGVTRSANTTRRCAAEKRGLHVVRISVGCAEGIVTCVALGATILVFDTT